jgi:hypothetical protein
MTCLKEAAACLAWNGEPAARIFRVHIGCASYVPPRIPKFGEFETEIMGASDITSLDAISWITGRRATEK